MDRFVSFFIYPAWQACLFGAQKDLRKPGSPKKGKEKDKSKKFFVFSLSFFPSHLPTFL